MSVSTVPTDIIYLGFNPTRKCQSAQFPQIPSIWALTNQPMSVSTTVPTHTIYLYFNLTSQCQSAQFPQIPSIWSLTLPANVSQHSSHRPYQPMSVSTVPTDTIYMGFNQPANVSQHSSHRYHLYGL